jgi:eukaryotic-like serine/threonine-protein kinase
VMEYVAGETLDQAIRRFPSGMPMEEIRRWLPGVADGVSYLHDNGLVHRDLKPANIFSDIGCVKVGDVGLSKFITQSRRSAQTQSVGTVYYMAPEVAKGRYGKEVDVYALGVILYEMLTGKVPFDGDSTGEILMKHLTEKPDLTKLPPRLRNVVGRSLEKDPGRRFDSPREFARAVDAAVVGREYIPVGGVDLEGPGTLGPIPPIPGFRGAMFRRASRADCKKGFCGMKPWPEEDGSGYGQAAFTWVCLLVMFSMMHIWVMTPICVMFILFFGANWAYRKVTGVGRGLAGFFRSVSGDLQGHLINKFEDPRRLSRWRNAGRHVATAGQHVAGAAHAVKSTVANAVFPASLSQSAAPALTRWTHWTGTAPLAAVVAVLVTIATTFVTDGFAPNSLFTVFSNPNPSSWAAFAAFVGSVIAASWGITAVCKYWEGRSPSGIARRLSLGALGLAVGASSATFSRFLAVGGNLPAPFAEIFMSDWDHNAPGAALVNEIQNKFGMVDPVVIATAMLFAAFFALRNWSRQTDEARPARFRLRSLFASVFVAWFTGALFGVMSPTFLTWAAVVSSTVQLASVWRPASAPSAQRVA